MLTARHVEASSEEVGAILRSILETVHRSGARLHPEAVIRERDGAMSIHCPAPADGVLVDMPRGLLVPIEGVTWAQSAEELRLVSATDGLTPVQRDLLDLQILLYNATGKIGWVVEHHPRVALAGQSELVAAIQSARPDFSLSADPAEAFLATRAFGLKPIPSGDGADDEEAPRTSVLLPVIDLLNHHPDGARLAVDARAMAVQSVTCGADDECFVSYGGRRDVLGLALGYGYLDVSTALAFSAPVRVEVPGFGVIAVGGRQLRPAHPLDPPLIELVGEELHLSHVTFDAHNPARHRAAVQLAVQGAALRRGQSGEQAAHSADAALESVAEANVDLLDELQAVARGVSGAAASLVAAAAQRQTDVIQAACSTDARLTSE